MNVNGSTGSSKPFRIDESRPFQILAAIPGIQQVIALGFLIVGFGKYVVGKTSESIHRAKDSTLKGRFEQIKGDTGTLNAVEVKFRALDNKITEDVCNKVGKRPVLSPKYDANGRQERDRWGEQQFISEMGRWEDDTREAFNSHPQQEERSKLYEEAVRLKEQAEQYREEHHTLEVTIDEASERRRAGKLLMLIAAFTIIPVVGTIFWGVALATPKK